MATTPTIVTLSTTTPWDVDDLNNNFQALRDHFLTVLGTDGTTGSENVMSGDLDVGGNRIRNAILNLDADDISISFNGVASINSVDGDSGNIDIVAGTGMTVTPDDGTKQITIASAAPSSIDGVSNAGGDIGFTGTGLMTITPDDSTNTITFATSAQNNTGSNVGSGSQVFKEKSGSDLQFRTIIAGDGLTATTNTNDITLVNKMGDINVTSVSDGQVLKLDSGTSKWTNQAVGSLTADLDDLTDVNAGSPTDGQVLTWVNASSEWQASNAGSVTNINDLGDVTITSATSGQVLSYNGSAWVNSAAGALTAALNDLTNVNASSPDTGATIYYDGTDWETKSDVYDVVAYGATGDGSTDDTTAIANALSALITAGSGVLYFPTGVYRTTSKLSGTLAVEDSIMVKGDGVGNSRIFCDHTGGGIDLTVNAGNGANGTGLTIRDLTFECDAGSSGNAIEIDGITGSGNTDPRVFISNILITKQDGSGTSFFTNGLYLDDIAFATIENFQYRGAGISNGTGIRALSNNTESPVDVWIRDFRITDCSQGIYITDDAEGHHINHGIFLNTNDGIYVDCTSAEPLFNVHDVDFNCHRYGIYMNNVIQSNLSNIHMYKNNASTVRFEGISMNGACADNIISNAYIEFLPGATGNGDGIAIKGTSTRTTVLNCKVRDSDTSTPDLTTGILLDSSTTNCTVLYGEVTNASNSILDNGTNNSVVTSSGSGASFRGALAYRSSNQLIANNTDVAVNWNAESYDTSSLVSGTTITVPSGVTKIKITAQIRWTNNTSGNRIVWVEKGGVGKVYPGSAFDVRTAQSSASTTVRQHCETAVLPVSGGDTFTVYARQDSGSSLNVESTHSSSWVQVDIIE